MNMNAPSFAGRTAWALLRSRGKGGGWAIAGIATVAGLACAAVLYGTTSGPWAFSDSAGYLASARSLVRGEGLGYPAPSGEFIPLSLHPPLFPFLLAVLDLGGIDDIEGARFLHAAFFGLLVGLVGIMVLRTTGSTVLGLAAAILAASSRRLVGLHTGLMSEPAFLLVSVISLLFLVRYRRSGSSIDLALAAVSVSMAPLAKYAGIAVVVGEAVWLLLAVPGARGRRIRRAAAFLAVGLLPVVLWFAYLQISQLGAHRLTTEAASGSTWTRTAPFRGELIDQTWDLLPVGSGSAAIPNRLKVALLTGLGGAYLAFLFVGRRALAGDHQERAVTDEVLALQGLLLLVALASAALLLGSFLFADPQPDLIDRTFAPYLLSLSLAALLGLWLVMATAFGPEKSGPIAAGVVLVAAALQVGSTYSFLEGLARAGQGYATDRWRSSATAAAAAALPAGSVLISNEPTALLLNTDRNAFSLEDLAQDDLAPGAATAEWGRALSERFACRSVELVLFDSPDDDSAGVPIHNSPQAGEPWDSIESYADGTIYALKPQSGCPSASP